MASIHSPNAGAKGTTPVSSTYRSHIFTILSNLSGSAAARSWISPGSRARLKSCHFSGPLGAGMKTI